MYYVLPCTKASHGVWVQIWVRRSGLETGPVGSALTRATADGPHPTCCSRFVRSEGMASAPQGGGSPDRRQHIDSRVVQDKARKGTTNELMIQIHPALARALKAGPLVGMHHLITDSRASRCPL
jgi:hypothetical protein